MEYRFLGRTGLKVSTLCLGTLTFGRETSQEESEMILNRFVAAGGTFIDTADVYSQGGGGIRGRTLAGRAATRCARSCKQSALPHGHRAERRGIEPQAPACRH